METAYPTPDTEDRDDSGAAGDGQMQARESLASFVFSAWRQASFHRRQSGIDEELLECLRQAKGEYSAEEAAKIVASSQPIVYVQNSDRKRRDCNTIIGAVFLNSSDQPWTLNPTPVPEISEDDAGAIRDQTMQAYLDYTVMTLVEAGVPEEEAYGIAQANPPDPLVAKQFAASRRDEDDNKRMENAREKVARMEKKMRDQLLEGRFREATTSVINSMSTYGTGILKGPCLKNRKRGHFVGGKYKISDTELLECSSINPLDAYPAKGTTDIQYGDFFEKVRFTARELNDMKKLGKGYYAANIDEILALHPNGGILLIEPTDPQRKLLENDGAVGAMVSSQIEGIEGWCDVRGNLLREQGITQTDEGAEIEETEYYPVNVIVIDGKAIFCSLVSENLGRPLYKGVFYKVEGSWWGESPLKKMRDPARAYNAAFRAKCVNIACCSGPMIFIGDSSRLKPGQNIKITPYSIIEFNDPAKRGDVPMKVFQAASNIMEINADLQETAKLIDTQTGIPSSNHAGDIAAGAGRTYNGLLLILTAAKDGANTVVFSMYLDILKPFLEYVYKYNMLFIDDDGIKGDCEVDAGGLLAILLKEQNKNQLDAFMQMVSQSPQAQKVIGDSGFASLLREYVKLLSGVNPDNIVPSKNEMERRARLEEIERKVRAETQAALAAAQTIGGPAVATGAGNTPVTLGQPSPLSIPARKGPTTEVDLSTPRPAAQYPVQQMEEVSL